VALGMAVLEQINQHLTLMSGRVAPGTTVYDLAGNLGSFSYYPLPPILQCVRES
jgi:hypothetical protein